MTLEGGARGGGGWGKGRRGEGEWEEVLHKIVPDLDTSHMVPDGMALLMVLHYWQLTHPHFSPEVNTKTQVLIWWDSLLN